MNSISQSQQISRTSILAWLLVGGGVIAICAPWIVPHRSQPESPQTIPGSNRSTNSEEMTVLPPVENLQGQAALECDLRLLREGLRLLEQTQDYSGLFRKQERVDGVLDQGSLLQVKGRHEPLGLYLKWLEGDAGRELLFVEGKFDGEMLVRLGGLRGRLLPALKLNPTGEIAKQEARHHISHVSIVNLTKHVIEHCQRDLNQLSELTCELAPDVLVREQSLIRVQVEYHNPKSGGEYRKAIHYLDRVNFLPVKILTYGWPEPGQSLAAEDVDAQTLLESYEYSQLQFNPQLTELDFSEDNPNYHFRRR